MLIRIKIAIVLLAMLVLKSTFAQMVDVQADYTGVGDCVFNAYNNTNVPVYLHLNFADLENTSFPDPLPYVKRLVPGFNSLFTLQRDLNADVPRFNYEIKSFRSNPTPIIDLEFPYLIPFEEDAKVKCFEVENIDGFRGSTKLENWQAVGFIRQAEASVVASRSGVVVEVVGAERKTEPSMWYNAWNYTVTVLHADGTLMCYRNVHDAQKKLKLGQKIYAGQKIGEMAPHSNQLIQLLYHHSLNTNGLLFVIPKYSISEKNNALLLSSSEYKVVHPLKICGLEMSKRERKKILGLKR